MKFFFAGLPAFSLILLLSVLLVVAQEVPYSEVAPELRPVDAVGNPLEETAGTTLIVASDIGRLEQELLSTQDAYLVQQGWVKTPDNPGSIWLWSKSVTLEDGRIRNYCLDTDNALSIEYLAEPTTDETPLPVEPVEPE